MAYVIGSMNNIVEMIRNRKKRGYPKRKSTWKKWWKRRRRAMNSHSPSLRRVEFGVPTRGEIP